MKAFRPLQGRRIVVTRPREQAEDLVRKLEERGATVLLAPLIKVQPALDPGPMLAAIADLGQFDWLVFTSANGVRGFFQYLRTHALPPSLRICAIGEATAAAVVREGGSVDLRPTEYVAESVVEAFKQQSTLADSRVLLARADTARDILPHELTACGAIVTDVAVYRTVPDVEGAEWLRDQLTQFPVDLITFTSSSTVRNFADLVTRDRGGALIASIGPITSATIRELGWVVDIEAEVYSAEGLLESISVYFGKQEV